MKKLTLCCIIAAILVVVARSAVAQQADLVVLKPANTLALTLQPAEAAVVSATAAASISLLATLSNGGQPVQGVVVTFTSTGKAYSPITPVQVTTAADGSAGIQVNLPAGAQPGLENFTAKAPDGTNTDTATVQVLVIGGSYSIVKNDALGGEQPPPAVCGFT